MKNMEARDDGKYWSGSLTTEIVFSQMQTLKSWKDILIN